MALVIPRVVFFGRDVKAGASVVGTKADARGCFIVPHVCCCLLAGMVFTPVPDKLDWLRFIRLELGTTGAGFGYH
jgi:hypothetical protein